MFSKASQQYQFLGEHLMTSFGQPRAWAAFVIEIAFSTVEAHANRCVNDGVEIGEQVQRGSKISSELRSGSERVRKESPEKCNEHTARHASQSVGCKLVDRIYRLSIARGNLAYNNQLTCAYCCGLGTNIPGLPLSVLAIHIRQSIPVLPWTGGQ